MGLAWYETNANDHEPYAGIHTIFLWDCLVRWLETNDLYNDWTSKQTSRGISVYKKTHLVIKLYDDYNVMKSMELSSIMYQDHQQVAKQWIHWFPGIYSHLDETRPFPYTLKRSVYWSPCSLNYCLVHSGEFHPCNLQYNSDYHLAISASDNNSQMHSTLDYTVIYLRALGISMSRY